MVDYKMIDSLRVVDYNDFSWRVKKKFDRIDLDKQDVLRTKKYNWMGGDKARELRAKVKTKDLRRWGYRG